MKETRHRVPKLNTAPTSFPAWEKPTVTEPQFWGTRAQRAQDTVAEAEGQGLRFAVPSKRLPSHSLVAKFPHVRRIEKYTKHRRLPAHARAFPNRCGTLTSWPRRHVSAINSKRHARFINE